MRIGIVAIIVCLSHGCAHHQLRFVTTKQAHTVEDVHTQQVLDNLAKFAANPNAMPHFSWPNAGSSNVNSTLTGGTGFNFSPQRLTSWMFNFGGTRAAGQSYTMTPINDPRKLELMRCAYQRAISSCCCTGESGSCPDCEKRFNKFYLGSESPSKVRETINGKSMSLATVVYRLPGLTEEYQLLENMRIYADRNEHNEIVYRLEYDPNQVVDIVYTSKEKNMKWLFRTEGKEEKAVYKLVELLANGTSKKYILGKEVSFSKIEPQPTQVTKSLYVDGSIALSTEASGQVTSECLLGPCWFKSGKKSDVPKRSRCSHIGNYCGCYVWVPECNRDRLTNLTLAILDIALNDPSSGRTKEVVAYLDSKQQPTTKSLASYKVTATVPWTGSAASIHPAAPAEAVAEAKIKLERARNEYKRSCKRFFGNRKKVEQLLDLNWMDELKLKEKRVDAKVFEREIAEALTLSLEDDNDRAEIAEIDFQLVSDYLALESAELSAEVAGKSVRNAAQIESEHSALEYLPPTRTPVPNAGYLQFQQNLDALAPR